LPGSLFQLLELFSELPYEVSIEVNKSMNGTIELFLTKGNIVYFYTDNLHESRTRCGIHIHTHPRVVPVIGRTRNIKEWPPSGTDISASIYSIIQVPIQKSKNINDSYKNQYQLKNGGNMSYDYVFDGYNLWYHKPNKELIETYKFLFDKMTKSPIPIFSKYARELSEIIKTSKYNSDNLGLDLNGLRKDLGFPQITIDQYLNGMRDIFMQKEELGYADDDVMGIDIGVIKITFKEQNIIIPDDLTCGINEQRIKHIILPETGLLDKDELQLLYKKAMRIMEGRSNFTKTQESFLG